MSYLVHHLALVGAYTLQHMALVLVSLAIALIIAVPLGIFAAHNRRIATPLLGALGVIYTIPSLALLAILVNYVGLGFWTAVIALVAYAQFLLVRNIATGLREVDPAQIDAATGLGMSPRERFWRVELPLAMPTVLGGIRIAAVTMISLATIAAYINAGGLGVLIFSGLSQAYPEKALAGSLPAAALAILADLVLRSFERRALKSSAS
ncbi:MAG: ABC transporter permease [Candidatus Baltobacteraceae bacterium]